MFFESTAGRIIGVQLVIFWTLVILALTRIEMYKPAILFFLIYIPIGFLYVHDINCTFIGQCTMWGWVKTVFLSFYLIILIIILLAFMLVGESPIINTLNKNNMQINVATNSPQPENKVMNVATQPPRPYLLPPPQNTAIQLQG